MLSKKPLPAPLRFYQRLYRQRRLRDSEGLFPIEGPRSFLAAVENGYQFHTVIRSRVLLRNSQAARESSRLQAEGVIVAHASPECFRVISKNPCASGIAAIVRKPTATIESAVVGSGLLVALTRIRSAGNFGTLVRTAAAVGCDGVLILGEKVDPFDPLVVRASMGAFFRVPMIRTSWREFQKWKNAHQAEVVAAHPGADRTHFEHCWRAPTVLMLGDERAGLSSRQLECADTCVRIPMGSDTDSLNLGVAGSVMMYEFMRSTLKSAPH